MASKSDGKVDVCQWVRQNFPKDASCLDVGACDGVWHELLGNWLKMDAVEIFFPNVTNNRLADKYRNVLVGDIADIQYEHYDLVIFGDVIEHMTVEKAQAVLEYASGRCEDMIIAVPYLYQQDEIYGNKYEKHLQPDLTEELFLELYQNFEVLLKPNDSYCYWHKKK